MYESNSDYSEFFDFVIKSNKLELLYLSECKNNSFRSSAFQILNIFSVLDNEDKIPEYYYLFSLKNVFIEKYIDLTKEIKEIDFLLKNEYDRKNSTNLEKLPDTKIIYLEIKKLLERKKAIKKEVNETQCKIKQKNEEIDLRFGCIIKPEKVLHC